LSHTIDASTLFLIIVSRTPAHGSKTIAGRREVKYVEKSSDNRRRSGRSLGRLLRPDERLRRRDLRKHSLPGGVCASWRRGEYLFDHCRHWVLGSGRGEASPCAWPAPAGWLRKYANTTGLNFAAQLDDPILDSNEQFLLIDRLVTYVHILEQTAQEE